MPTAEIVVEKYYPQIRRIAQKLCKNLPAFVDVEDLIQEGMVALLEAKARYNSEAGCSFKTFAFRRASGAMIDSLRAASTLGRKDTRYHRKIREAEVQLVKELHREPLSEEIADRVGIPLCKLQKTVGRVDASRRISLAHVVDEDKGTELVEILEDSTMQNPEMAAIKRELSHCLKSNISRLSQRERRILRLYHFGGMTMREIATEIGVVESRVSQINAGIIAKLSSSVVSRQAFHTV